MALSQPESGPVTEVPYTPAGSFKGRRLAVGLNVTVSLLVAGMLAAVLQRWAFQKPVKWDLTS